jgi:multiple sugar transport system permease protein
MYTPGGIADALTSSVLGGTLQWLSNPDIALWAIVITDIWQWTPLVVLVMLAGLQAIPEHVTEAAIIDGASRWQRFVDITLPYMRQLIVLTLIIRIIGSMREFAKVFVLTRGGPAGATNVVSIELYHEAFQFGNFGTASAMALILLVLVIAIAFLFVKIARVEF